MIAHALVEPHLRAAEDALTLQRWATANHQARRIMRRTARRYRFAAGAFAMARSVVVAEDFERSGTVQTLFRSLGTDATGTLNAWTPDLGVFSIAANQVTAPVGVDRSTVAGHLDWTDCTYQQRFQFATNAIPRAIVHWSLQYQYLFATVDGTNLQWGQFINGAWAGMYGTPSAVPLVNGTWYWFQLTCSGNTYTAKIFADAAGAINLATQVGATSQATFTVNNQTGKIGIGNSGTATCLFGGAFANVCQVTGPVPVDYFPIAVGGEPAFCWSKNAPYAGAYSQSIFLAHSSGNGGWNNNPFPGPAGIYTMAARIKAPVGGGFQMYAGGSGAIVAPPSATDGTWQFLSGSITTVGSSRATWQAYSTPGTYYVDNMAIYQGTPVVAQPTILRTGGAGGRSIVKFGNLPLPNGQGVMPNIDLNDYVNTLLPDYLRGDDSNRQIGLEQFLYLARGAYTSDDFGPRSISLPMTYVDDATHFLGSFLATLSQAGEQQLTFDNATYIGVKFNGAKNRVPALFKQPLAWDFVLELIAADPWFKDLVASAMTALALTVDAGQNFVIPYQGTVKCEPVFTLQVPATNPVAINSLTLTNLLLPNDEILTVNFLSLLPIPALTARTITIDSAASSAVDDLGRFYDVSGSFPRLYPAGRQPLVDQFNPFSIALVPASGATAGLSLACAYTPRWQI